MLKDVWDSFKDNVKERVNNPFLGTFLLVWIVKNWKVVYAFFFFDKDIKLQQRIDYFLSYWKNQSFVWNLICVAFITIGILAITYLFLAFSRLLSNYFENVIIPFVSKISKGKIVRNEIYEEALSQIELLKEKVEKERKDKYEAIEERNQFEKRLTGNNIQLLGMSNDSVSITPNYNSSIVPEAIRLFGYDEIQNVLLTIDKGFGFGGDYKPIDFLLRHDFIQLKNGQDWNEMIYEYNPEGKIFRRQFLDYKKQ